MSTLFLIVPSEILVPRTLKIKMILFKLKKTGTHAMLFSVCVYMHGVQSAYRSLRVNDTIAQLVQTTNIP